MKKGVTEQKASEIALREVRKLYGADAAPLTDPWIITRETQSASMKRRMATLFSERPDLFSGEHGMVCPEIRGYNHPSLF